MNGMVVSRSQYRNITIKLRGKYPSAQMAITASMINVLNMCTM